MPRIVQCAYLKKEAEGLDFPPYPVHTELGKRVWETVSKEAWAAWMKHQTMLVNENRLNLADLRARRNGLTWRAHRSRSKFLAAGGPQEAIRCRILPAVLKPVSVLQQKLLR